MSFALLTRAKYAIFFQLLGRQLATGLATVLSYEQAHAKADEMRALDMAKSAFFQNSSHELRTPLTLILGPLDDVLREQRQSLPPAIRSTLQICHRNAQRLLGLVNGLLDFSRLARRLCHRSPADAGAGSRSDRGRLHPRRARPARRQSVRALPIGHRAQRHRLLGPDRGDAGDAQSVHGRDAV